MKKSFKAGEVVMLKSGGLSMTVAGYSNGLVEVVYMTAGSGPTLVTARLPEGVLKTMEVRKVKRTIVERELRTKVGR